MKPVEPVPSGKPPGIFVPFALMAFLVASVSIAVSGHFEPALSEKRKVIILLESRLSGTLSDSLTRYESLLKSEGYQPVLMDGVSSGTKPEEIRSILQKEFDESDGTLAGAVLVGNIPAVLYNEKHAQGDPYKHDHLCDLFYMDLNGSWEDSDGNGVYDTHKDYGNRYADRIFRYVNGAFGVPEKKRLPEIWVSRIRADSLESLGSENDLLRFYFEKILSYRRGEMPLPPRRAFVVAPGIDVMRSGWGARPHKLFSDVTVSQCREGSSSLLKELLASETGYELGIINVFSGPGIHHFDYFEGDGIDPSWWKSHEGKLLINEYSDKEHKPYDVTARLVKSIGPNVLFYHLLTSEVGRHDRSDYLAGAYIFFGSGLAAIAGTQHSGAIGTPVLYDHLASGMAVGNAWKESIRWAIEHSGEEMEIQWCDRKETWTEGKDPYKAVLVGDGTLKLPSSKRKDG